MPEILPVATPLEPTPMSHDPYDRYSRLNRIESNCSRLFDGSPRLDDEGDEMFEERRKPRQKGKFQSYYLADENLDLLPARHRDVIELLLKGYSIAYVAEDLQLTPAAVEKIVRAAERRIQEAKR